MGDPYQLDMPSRLGRERPGLLGDYKLKLDPTIQAEIDAITVRMEIQKLQNAWLQPNWLDLHQLVQGLSPAVASGQSPPPWTKFMKPATPKPLIPMPQLQPRGDGTDELEYPRAAAISDLLGALWTVPEVKEVGTKLTDQLESDFWTKRTAGEKTLIVTWGTIIAGGAIAGMLANRQSRLWAFQTISDKEIPVPKVGGFSFQVGLAPGTAKQEPTVNEPPPYQGYYFVAKLDLFEAVPSLAKWLKR